jgi:hypothetical protein
MSALPSLSASPASPASAPSPAVSPLPPRAFFAHVSRPLFCRLLAPFADALSALDISLPALAASDPNDRTLLNALHDRLDALQVPAGAPERHAAAALLALVAPLLDRLAAVCRVATPGGREALIKADKDRRLPPRLGPEDLAVTAFLDFPDLFSAVRVPAASDAIKGFVLFEAAAHCEPAFEPDAIAATTAYLGKWFDERHRTARCDIVVRRRDGELHFEITHGKTPSTLDLIDESLALKVVTQVSAQRSYAVYYLATRVLAVHAMEFIKDGLRKAFGHGCGDGEGFFAKSESLLDMAPLRDLGASLAPDAELGVTRVELRAIDVTAADGSGASYWPNKGDVRTSSQYDRVRAALAEEGARATYLKLAIEMTAARRTQLVEIHALRNQLSYDRRDPGVERTLLAWLTRRGVWRGGGASSEDGGGVPNAEAAEAS